MFKVSENMTKCSCFTLGENGSLKTICPSVQCYIIYFNNIFQRSPRCVQLLEVFIVAACASSYWSKVLM